MSRAAGEGEEPPGVSAVAPVDQEERLELLEKSQEELQRLVRGLQQELRELRQERSANLPNAVPDTQESLPEEAFPLANAHILEVPVSNADMQSPKTTVTSQRGKTVNYDQVDSKASEDYFFQSSTWDLALFVGTDVVGTFGSLHTMVLVLSTFMIQLVFVGVVALNFSQPRVDHFSIQDAKRWRLATGHMETFWDPLTKASLASRVCNNDQALHVANGQASLFQTVNTYLGEAGAPFLFRGPVLGMVALTLWFLMVSDDVTTTLDLGRVLMTIPTGPTCLVLDTDDEDDPKYVLSHLSFSRKLWGTLITVVRLAVACVLLCFGSLYVVQTIYLPDLVLNCIALEIVLNVDDLLFTALASTPSRFLMNTLQPIKLPNMPRRKGLDVKAFCMLLAVPVALLLVNQLVMRPMLYDIQAVHTELCGGFQDFVWLEDARRMAVMAETKPYRMEGDDISKAVADNPLAVAVDDVTDNYRSGSTKGIWKTNHRTLYLWGEQNFATALDSFKPTCEDTDSTRPEWYYMKEVAGDQFDSCETVKPFCSSVTLESTWAPDQGRGILARMLCPMTCLCWSEISPRLIQTGCPSSCTQTLADGFGFTVQHRNEEFENAPCKDLTVPQLRATPAFTAWIAQLRSYANATSDDKMATIANLMWEDGCNIDGNYTTFACYYSNPGLASGARPFGGFSFFCSETCCDSNNPGPDTDTSFQQMTCPFECFAKPSGGSSGPQPSDGAPPDGSSNEPSGGENGTQSGSGTGGSGGTDSGGSGSSGGTDSGGSNGTDSGGSGGTDSGGSGGSGPPP